MTTQHLMVFFDESGKNTDKPTLMGGLSIPANIYFRGEIAQHQGIEIHWSGFSAHGEKKAKIRNFLLDILRFKSVIRLNVINYDQSVLEHNQHMYVGEEDLAERTIYAKFPERIIYGLLRKYGKYTQIDARVIVEECSQYDKHKLSERMKRDLNEQSIYRGENFSILDVKFGGKGEHIGLELTDLLLGIIRTVIKNADADVSKREQKKIEFVLELLRDTELAEVLKHRVKYFEWTSSSELLEVGLDNYIDNFISKNHESWFR